MRILTMILLGCYCSLPLLAQDTTDSAETSAAQDPQDTEQEPTAQESTAQQPAARQPTVQQPTAQQPTAQQPGGAGPTHPPATTYTTGYEVRLKIHKYASWATIPLFATELALGQSLYNHPETGAKKNSARDCRHWNCWAFWAQHVYGRLEFVGRPA